MTDGPLVVSVRTGDLQGAGTNANVSIILHDNHGTTSPKINLNHFFRDDFERGNTDKFELQRTQTERLCKLDKLEIFRDDSGFGSSWYVERITVENKSNGDVYTFPVFRWLRPHYHYVFRENDTFLPQDDAQQEQRRLDLEDKRKLYKIKTVDLKLPASTETLPVDEMFSGQYRWDLQKLKLSLIIQSKITMVTAGKWKTLDDIRNVYVMHIFNEPKSSKVWQDDSFFGQQRTAGLCPALIRLCTRLPEKLGIGDGDLLPFLEGQTIGDVLTNKRLFCCDLNILHQFPPKDKEHVICAPILLLYRTNSGQLLPVAIQLFQEPGPDNPVFLPSDDQYVWLMAKMWYNHAETSYHQSLAHLGFTHLLMEGVSLGVNRNLAISHPIYKLLSPHLLYIIAINSRAVEKLLAQDGWIQNTMTVGRNGVINLVKLGVSQWRLDVDGTLPEDLKRRGVYDKEVLPNFHYRDDGLLLYNAINTYVTKYVNLYYESNAVLLADWEVQAFAKELVALREDGGIGMRGVPGNGEFRYLKDFIQTLTSFIFTCSVQHAAVNFPQYDYYGFPPAYPATLNGSPPSDKSPLKMVDILHTLPDRNVTFDIMVVTKMLSSKGVKSLGDYEVQYVFDPKATVVQEEFRRDLKEVGREIEKRNETRNPPYDYLHPDAIPNSISI
ncbi:polyunsaturated fatty acid 5-lipoxygenase-like [Haliotis rufescens]|uniref:polyunsaturated fatty acid 5-lipoxygenase-like n=1 Tax=Haliotis rufescens TaxID=6454 RepID=UPI001EB02DDE|nr:polyunsaturated fatty acid 5-lipoxygenase-like [Haliotis rufescens]